MPCANIIWRTRLESPLSLTDVCASKAVLQHVPRVAGAESAVRRAARRVALVSGTGGGEAVPLAALAALAGVCVRRAEEGDAREGRAGALIVGGAALRLAGVAGGSRSSQSGAEKLGELLAAAAPLGALEVAHKVCVMAALEEHAGEARGGEPPPLLGAACRAVTRGGVRLLEEDIARTTASLRAVGEAAAREADGDVASRRRANALLRAADAACSQLREAVTATGDRGRRKTTHGWRWLPAREYAPCVADAVAIDAARASGEVPPAAAFAEGAPSLSESARRALRLATLVDELDRWAEVDNVPPCGLEARAEALTAAIAAELSGERPQPCYRGADVVWQVTASEVFSRAFIRGVEASDVLREWGNDASTESASVYEPAPGNARPLVWRPIHRLAFQLIQTETLALEGAVGTASAMTIGGRAARRLVNLALPAALRERPLSAAAHRALRLLARARISCTLVGVPMAVAASEFAAVTVADAHAWATVAPLVPCDARHAALEAARAVMRDKGADARGVPCARMAEEALGAAEGDSKAWSQAECAQWAVALAAREDSGVDGTLAALDALRVALEFASLATHGLRASAGHGHNPAEALRRVAAAADGLAVGEAHPEALRQEVARVRRDAGARLAALGERVDGDSSRKRARREADGFAVADDAGGAAAIAGARVACLAVGAAVGDAGAADALAGALRAAWDECIRSAEARDAGRAAAAQCAAQLSSSSSGGFMDAQLAWRASLAVAVASQAPEAVAVCATRRAHAAADSLEDLPEDEQAQLICCAALVAVASSQGAIDVCGGGAAAVAELIHALPPIDRGVADKAAEQMSGVLGCLSAPQLSSLCVAMPALREALRDAINVDVSAVSSAVAEVLRPGLADALKAVQGDEEDALATAVADGRIAWPAPPTELGEAVLCADGDVRRRAAWLCARGDYGDAGECALAQLADGVLGALRGSAPGAGAAADAVAALCALARRVPAGVAPLLVTHLCLLTHIPDDGAHLPSVALAAAAAAAAALAELSVVAPWALVEGAGCDRLAAASLSLAAATTSGPWRRVAASALAASRRVARWAPPLDAHSTRAALEAVALCQGVSAELLWEEAAALAVAGGAARALRQALDEARARVGGDVSGAACVSRRALHAAMALN